MVNKIRDNIDDLMKKKITKEDLLNKLEINKSMMENYILEMIKLSYASHDGEMVEDAIYLIFLYECNLEIFQEDLNKLLTCDWHKQHEEIRNHAEEQLARDIVKSKGKGERHKVDLLLLFIILFTAAILAVPIGIYMIRYMRREMLREHLEEYIKEPYPPTSFIINDSGTFSTYEIVIDI